jgi:hypothetical protein
MLLLLPASAGWSHDEADKDKINKALKKIAMY